MLPSKKTWLTAAILSSLLTLSIAGTSQVNVASARDFPSLVTIGMPAETINYTITRINGTLWAKIDGTYPLYVVFASLESANLSSAPFFVSSDELPLVYPTPPGTTNIHVKIGETELDWNNFTQFYPTALHHTAIGDWQMVNCTIKPIPDDFVLKIHYEHPLEKVNGTYLFLYDLNISPYLSPAYPNSTAYFIIRTEPGISVAQAYTTGLDSAWKPKTYTTTQEGTAKLATIEMFSEYSEPLAGDLVVTFTDANAQPQNENALILTAAILIIVVLIALVIYRRRRNH